MPRNGSCIMAKKSNKLSAAKLHSYLATKVLDLLRKGTDEEEGDFTATLALLAPGGKLHNAVLRPGPSRTKLKRAKDSSFGEAMNAIAFYASKEANIAEIGDMVAEPSAPASTTPPANTAPANTAPAELPV